MALRLTNNATSKLAVSITSSSTNITIVPGDGQKFPSLSSGDWFPLTLVRTDGTLEIVRCTARTGDVFTVIRGQENTTATEFTAGDRIELRYTAGAAQEVVNAAQSVSDIFAKANLTVIRPVPDQPVLVKVDGINLAIRAGTKVLTGDAVISFDVQTGITPISMTGGMDYSVWVKPDGSSVIIADPITAPAAPPVAGSTKIGGFHYSLVPPGTTVAIGSFATTGTGFIWTQADVDRIAGINEHSIWDVGYRPKCDPRGMACVKAENGRPAFWYDIYFCSQDHITNGTSRYNTNVATLSGSTTVYPKIPLMFGGNGTALYSDLNWFTVNEIAISHGKRMLSLREFSAAAYGVTEKTSLSGTGIIPATTRQPGFTSKTGGEQMTGHAYVHSQDMFTIDNSLSTNPGDRGLQIGATYSFLMGGSRGASTQSGSRATQVRGTQESQTNYAIRLACDHIS